MRMTRLRFYVAAGALMATIIAGQASALPTDVFEELSDTNTDEIVVHHVLGTDSQATRAFLRGRVVSIRDSLVCIRSEPRGAVPACEHVVDLSHGLLHSDRMPEEGDSIEVFGELADIILI